ncbi:MAG TPA: sensor histidine kinase, partial [Oceanospirillales bacterium]|nr:sensor histidine kinase [Oceanospirillales bacterium]
AEQGSETLWIINRKNLIKYQKTNKKCQNYTLNKGSNSFTSIIIDNQQTIWLSSTAGLYRFDPASEKLISASNELEHFYIDFIAEFSNNVLLLGCKNGLFKYHVTEHKLEKITSLSQKKIKFNDYTLTQNQQYFFATNGGIALLDEQGLSINTKTQDQPFNNSLSSIYADSRGNLWLGSDHLGLYKYNLTTEQIEKIPNPEGIINLLIAAIVEMDDFLWVATNHGLLRLNLDNNKSHYFHTTDGLQGEIFNDNAVYKSAGGKLYFGGRNGYNAFFPQQIKINGKAPNIILSKFTRFGKTIQPGTKEDGFALPQPINQMQSLTLSHQDYVIGFEFAALDFADPTRNKYAYMMEGLEPAWNHVNADNRSISYTNLKAGNYTFRVKGSNKDGIWNEAGKSLHIRVLPAPWLSWWAYGLYELLLLALFYWYINRKNKANQRITLLLKTEVEKQTKELQKQKQTVEDLLARKNELFANVSHEFRTPLTLILGPINRLLKSPLAHKDLNALKMVSKNANRLLTMIEQILQLAKYTNSDNIQLLPIKTKERIQSIVDSFMPLAEEKRIAMRLLENADTAIETSTDALEIILGNLISNAIKYTPIGGEITIRSMALKNKLHLQVIDTGCGLDQEQQKDIFDRFKRLHTHHNIEGIGIGLSVVEELLKVNDASLKIDSKPGMGSNFSVIFNLVAMEFAEGQNHSNNLLLNQLINEPLESNIVATAKTIKTKRRESILIIDDNHDMRMYIA